MMTIKDSLAAVVILLALATAAGAQPGSADATTTSPDGTAAQRFTAPCSGEVRWADSGATYSDFDFWVGEWQVYDLESGILMGFDEVDKAFGGCALRQHWRQMNDRYSIAGAARRLDGGSVTALGPGGKWHQTWVDNSGSNISLSGGLDASGVIVLESEWLEFKSRQGQEVRVKYKWHWDPQGDGSIHNWGLRASGAGDPIEWQKTFDIVYRRNAPKGPTARLYTNAE